MSLLRSSVLFVGLACLLLIGATRQCLAETLTEQLPNKITVNAEFLPADTQKPAILMIHGFLQTYEFMSTWNIVTGLASMGYTVLAPNLSLGVPNRKQSVQCKAAHTHTFGDDLVEIDYWVQWLANKGYKSIILIGHSWGSQYLLGYSLTHPKAPITAIIAISLVRTHQAGNIHRLQIKEAGLRLKKHDTSLHSYKLSFCDAFMAAPQTYLSYAEWDDQHVLAALDTLHRRQVPVHVIIGDQDKRIDKQWIKEVEPKVSKLTVVEGANHFFSAMHEFELNDRLEQIINQIDK